MICADGDGALVRERGGIRVGELQEAEEVPFPGLVCSEDGRRWVIHDAGALGCPWKSGEGSGRAGARSVGKS